MMATNPAQDRLRPSGFTGIDEMPWGSHYCYFYHSSSELLSTIVPFLRAGLEANEKCIALIDDPLSPEDVRERLAQVLPDVVGRERSGQLELVRGRQWYIGASGTLNSEDIIATWHAKLEESLDGRFAGVRATGDTSWLVIPDWDAFLAYEGTINEKISSLPMIALCTYPLSGLDPKILLHALSNHQDVIVPTTDGYRLMHHASPEAAYEAATATLAEELSRERRLSREKDQMLGIASHELRTPMAAQRLYLELAQQRVKERNDLETYGLLEETIAQLDDVVELIGNLMDIAHHHLEHLPIERSKTDLHDLVRTVIGRVQRTTTTHTLYLRGERDLTAHVDSSRIAQALSNLLTNAVKYSPKSDHVMVTLAREGDEAIIAIKDKGKGIPPSEQQRVFECFYRIPDDERSVKGSGIGLFLVKRIVDAHGAAIELSSTPGRGTEVRLRIPLTVEESAETTARPEAAGQLPH